MQESQVFNIHSLDAKTLSLNGVKLSSTVEEVEKVWGPPKEIVKTPTGEELWTFDHKTLGRNGDSIDFLSGDTLEFAGETVLAGTSIHTFSQKFGTDFSSSGPEGSARISLTNGVLELILKHEEIIGFSLSLDSASGHASPSTKEAP